MRNGVATLLVGIRDYRENECSGGVDSTILLNEAVRRLTDDPYLTLGVEADSDEAAIKKAYRKLALQFHPDKSKATSSVFRAVQGADVSIHPSRPVDEVMQHFSPSIHWEGKQSSCVEGAWVRNIDGASFSHLRHAVFRVQ